MTSLLLVGSFWTASILFEPNFGQTRSDVEFFGRAKNLQVMATADSVWLLPADETKAVRLRLTDQPRAHIVAEGRAPGIKNYYLGSDPSRWITELPLYERLRLQAGPVTWVLHTAGGAIELDCELESSEGARCAFEVDGAEALGALPSGEVAIGTGSGAIILGTPVSFDDHGRPLPTEVLVDEQRVTYVTDRVGPYTVDPVLLYSSFFGGSDFDTPAAVAVDQANNAYVVGYTQSTDFPGWAATGAHSSDLFASKLDVQGNLIYSTVVGGAGGESNGPSRLAFVQPDGELFFGGQTDSTDFPIMLAVQGTFGGGTADGVFVGLGPTGSLKMSSYLGGTGDDRLSGIAADNNDDVYLVLTTASTGGLATTGGAQQTHNGGGYDAFVAIISDIGSTTFATYLGGNGDDIAAGLGLDGVNRFCVAGKTASTNFPTHLPLPGQTGLKGSGDGFVTKYDGTTLPPPIMYSTYFGGSDVDNVNAMTLDTGSSCIIAGSTLSTDLPTSATAYKKAAIGNRDAWVAKIGPTGGNIEFSTYYGGTNRDTVYAVTTGLDDSVYLLGDSESTDFDLSANAVQKTYGGGGGGGGDVTIVHLSADGSTLLFATYLGGTDTDYGFGGIGVDKYGRIFAAADPGETANVSDFPTTAGAKAPTYLGGAGDVIYFTIGERTPQLTSVSPVGGLPAGNTAVQISGANFLSGATVTFGGTACTSVVVTNSSTITCNTPAAPTGAVDVVVQNPDGQSATGSQIYRYAPAPTIALVTPAQGPIAGGTTITITGANFLAGVTVTLGGVALTPTLSGSTTITVTTLATAEGPVTLVVTNDDGQSATLSSAFSFVAPPPIIASIAPSAASTNGVTSVTISGSSFQSGATVLFGTVAATDVTFVSSGSLTMTAPPQSVGGMTSVTLKNPDGQQASSSIEYDTPTPAPVGDVALAPTTTSKLKSGCSCRGSAVDPSALVVLLLALRALRRSKPPASAPSAHSTSS